MTAPRLSDRDLTAVLASVADGFADAATASALSDLLADATAEDRLAAVTWLVFEALKANDNYQSPTTATISDRHVGLAHQSPSADNLVERLTQNCMARLGRSIQPNHWYAVRLEHDRQQFHSLTRWRTSVVLTVTPLDGGTVAPQQNPQG